MVEKKNLEKEEKKNLDSENVSKILQMLKEMKLEELNDLSEAVKKTWNLKDISISGDQKEEKKEEKKTVSLILNGFGENKTKTTLQLVSIFKKLNNPKTTMEVFKMSTPFTIAENLSVESANEFKKDLDKEGSQTEIK